MHKLGKERKEPGRQNFSAAGSGNVLQDIHWFSNTGFDELNPTKLQLGEKTSVSHKNNNGK